MLDGHLPLNNFQQSGQYQGTAVSFKQVGLNHSIVQLGKLYPIKVPSLESWQ